MSSNKKNHSASAHLDAPVYSLQKGIRATDTKWPTTVQLSSGVGTKDENHQKTCTTTSHKVESASRLLGPVEVDPWDNFEQEQREWKRKQKPVFDRSAPSYIAANHQLRNYKWLLGKLWDADSWLNAIPEKFDDQQLSMGFDEVLAMSIDDSESCQQEIEISKKQTSEQLLKLDKMSKLCDTYQCDGRSPCFINCGRHIFW